MTTKRTVGIHQNQVIQQWVEMLSLLPQQHTCFAVGYVGWSYISPQQMSHRIDHQKALTAARAAPL